jgi:hypothetical protein
VAGHLNRGRAILARRLARQGVAVSGAALAAALAGSTAKAQVPTSVASSTIKAATLIAAGQATAAASSIAVAALTEGVLKAMFVNKLKTSLAVCVVAGLVTLGSVFAYRTDAADRNPPPVPSTTPDRLADTLILLDKQWWEAASKYDVDTLGKILADDWVGGSWNKTTSLEHYRHARYVELKLLTERRVVRIDERTALMSYELTWRAEDKDKGQPRESAGHDRIIHCWVQRDGGWFVKYTECVNLPIAKEVAAPPVAPDPDPVTPVRPLPPEVPPPASGEIPPGIPFTPGPLEPFEITPFPPQPTPWKDRVRASSASGDNTPEKAFDGVRETMWNSGNYAPGWIEKDLGVKTALASIVLCASQTPEGPTIHEIWVSDEPIGNDRTKAKLAHTFKGTTKNADSLRFDFPKDMSARYVQILTTESPSWIGWWEIEITVKAK